MALATPEEAPSSCACFCVGEETPTLPEKILSRIQLKISKDFNLVSSIDRRKKFWRFNAFIVYDNCRFDAVLIVYSSSTPLVCGDVVARWNVIDGNVSSFSLEDIVLETPGLDNKSDQVAEKPREKVLRRLAQNREAARKSRLKKKAYIQQLESTRAKLSNIQNELDNVKKKGLLGGVYGADSASGLPSTINSGLVAFEMEYRHWIEEQNKHRCELRAALQAHVSEIELRILVESVMHHNDELFRIKATGAKADVFYLMSGMWATRAERFFFWIGGFRPSELLKVLMQHLEPLTEQQTMAAHSLLHSSQQAEDALSQGIDKLQQTLAESISSDSLGSSVNEKLTDHMASGVRTLDSLVDFVTQADNLRQQMLQQMHQILTTRQAARGLLALGDYFQRLRALSSLWAARPHHSPN
ncbi:transcription factor TGA6-like [Wolffia australiana]